MVKKSKITLKKLILIPIVVIINYIILTYFSTPEPTSLPDKKNERYYQVKMCNKLRGKIEYRLPDKTRVDCLTREYAIEVDWAKKWAEGIGQALYYANITHKKPAVALIVGQRDERYLKRLDAVASEFDIKVIILDK
jgi:hypothetical protein